MISGDDIFKKIFSLIDNSISERACQLSSVVLTRLLSLEECSSIHHSASLLLSQERKNISKTLDKRVSPMVLSLIDYRLFIIFADSFTEYVRSLRFLMKRTKAS